MQRFILVLGAAVGVAIVFGSFAYFEYQISFCATDEELVSCVREWVNPIAAIFTFVAVWYAARQVIEARRQSSAAVRDSLLHLRSDLESEVAKVLRLRKKIEDLVPLPKAPPEQFAWDNPTLLEPEIVERLAINRALSVSVRADVDDLVRNANVSDELQHILYRIADNFFDVFELFPGCVFCHGKDQDFDLWISEAGSSDGKPVEIFEIDIESGKISFILDGDPDSWVLTQNAFFSFWSEIDSYWNGVLKEKWIVSQCLGQIDLELTKSVREATERRMFVAEKNRGRSLRMPGSSGL